MNMNQPAKIPVKEMSGEDLTKLINTVRLTLPADPQGKANLLQQALSDMPATAQDLILGSIYFGSGANAVAQDVVLKTRQVGKPVVGAEALGFLIRGLSQFLVDVEVRGWLDGLFLRYALDERTVSAPLTEDRWKGDVSSQTEFESIIGDNTLQPVYFLSQAVAASHAVIHLTTPQGRGTGFLIGEGLIMTCNHVVSKQADLAQTFILFNYELEADLKLKTTADAIPNTEIPIVTSPKHELDFTIFAFQTDKIAGELPDGLKPLPLRRDAVQAGQRVSIIQHPGGGPKMFSMRNNLVQFADERLLQYRTSTLEGSSGSPVFNDSLEVVGVHSKGDSRKDKQVGGVDFLRNQGTAIGAILDYVKAKSPETYDRLILCS
jgi:V8-like Glu-specific endopeptidase